MSSLSALTPVLRPRLVAIAVLVIPLVLLGFVVPFWIVLGVASLFVLVIAAVRALRQAAQLIDQIIEEELPPNGVGR
jgi:hypothetical protein